MTQDLSEEFSQTLGGLMVVQALTLRLLGHYSQVPLEDVIAVLRMAVKDLPEEMDGLVEVVQAIVELLQVPTDPDDDGGSVVKKAVELRLIKGGHSD